MANEDKIDWGTTTAFPSLAVLESLADANIWHSAILDDAEPSNQVVRISYHLIGVAAADGDSLIFYLIQADENATAEILSGDVAATETELVAGTGTEEVQTACPIVWEHHWITNHAQIFKGIFDIWNFGPSWALAIEAQGFALTTGNKLWYRYGTPQRQ